jgi:hypothetical protein
MTMTKIFMPGPLRESHESHGIIRYEIVIKGAAAAAGEDLARS